MARKSRKETAMVSAMQKQPVVYHAAAYIRLSSDAKRKPGDSLETQQDTGASSRNYSEGIV